MGNHNFDLMKNGAVKLSKLFKKVGPRCKFLVVSFTSDWLYPLAGGQELVAELAEAGLSVVYRNLNLLYGHDSSLVYSNTLDKVL